MNRLFALVSLIGVLSLGLAVAGCGGDDDNGSNGSSSQEAPSQSDETALKAVVAEIETATKTADAKKFCELFEPSRMEEWVGKEECIKTFAPALKSSPKSVTFKVEKIEVDGDNATITFDHGRTANFDKVDGEWYIETPETEPPPAPEAEK